MCIAPPIKYLYNSNWSACLWLWVLRAVDCTKDMPYMIYVRVWKIMNYSEMSFHIEFYVHVYLVGSFHSNEASSWRWNRCMHSLLLNSQISSLRRISHSHLSFRMNGKLRRDGKQVAPPIRTQYIFRALIRWSCRWFSSALDPTYGPLFLLHTTLIWAQSMGMATIKQFVK